MKLTSIQAAVLKPHLAKELFQEKAKGVYLEIIEGELIATTCKKSPFEIIDAANTENTNLLTKLKENGISI
jgi:hypothetical protein